jgi:hypothetical protein
MWGALWNTLVRDNLHVHHTADVAGTAHVLACLLERCVQHHGAGAASRPDHLHMAAPAAVRRRDNITPAVCYAWQLQQIPGVSPTAAAAIVAAFPCLADLVRHVQEPGPAGKKNTNTLDAVMVGKRRLGPVLAGRVRRLFTFAAGDGW